VVPQSLRYDGRALDLLTIYLRNVVLTLFTVGIYRFWAKTDLLRFTRQHTRFFGGRFDYHASGKEMFINFLKALALLSVLIALVVLLVKLSVQDGREGPLAFVLGFYGFFLLLFCLRPLILVGSMRFRMSRTSWNGVRFGFDGRVSHAYGLYIRDGLLIVLTLGLYACCHHVRVRRFKAEHTLIGGQRFAFHGSALEYLGLSLGGVAISYMTLGLFVPWYIAWLTRFNIDNLSFQNRRFRSTFSGWQILKIAVGGGLATVCTLGLAFPWAVSMFQRAYTDSISYLGEPDLSVLRGTSDPRASALAVGLGEAGEVFESLGEIFGG